MFFLQCLPVMSLQFFLLYSSYCLQTGNTFYALVRYNLVCMCMHLFVIFLDTEFVSSTSPSIFFRMCIRLCAHIEDKMKTCMCFWILHWFLSTNESIWICKLYPLNCKDFVTFLHDMRVQLSGNSKWCGSYMAWFIPISIAD